MSYDLYFRPRDGRRRPNPEELLAFFAERPMYETSAQQAWYENKNTGVYFSFEIEDPPESSDTHLRDQDDLLPFAFNLNLFRPHVFGLEAEPELSALVEHFDLLVNDPQIGGMGEGEYSRERFLNSYNVSNEAASRAVLKELDGETIAHPFPTDRLESVWRWNYEAERFNDELGPSIYVSPILYHLVDGQVKTTVIWCNGWSAVLPEVDTVILHRDKLTCSQWLRQAKKTVCVWYEDVRPLLEKYPRGRRAMPYFHLEYDHVPHDIQQFMKHVKPTVPGKLCPIASDKVLDQGLLLPS